MGIVNSDFTNGLTGWTTSSLSCGSWLQSVAPEPPFVHIKAQSCNIWIQQDFIVDDPVLTFDWSYWEQYGSYGGCDAYSYWSLTRISDGVILKSGNLTGGECGASSGTVTEDVSAYIGTNARIRFTLDPANWYAYQSELWIGNARVYSPTCPSAPKYSGNTVTLKATPKDGIGPYYVVFRKNEVDIDQSRLGGLLNPIIDAQEDIQITRVYTLDDLDISSAPTGTIDFSVYMEDSCPTGAKTCIGTCTITIGCLAPVCNFTVT